MFKLLLRLSDSINLQDIMAVCRFHEIDFVENATGEASNLATSSKRKRPRGYIN